MGRLTEAERQGALEAYALTGNYRQVAREFGVSEGAIRKLVRTRKGTQYAPDGTRTGKSRVRKVRTELEKSEREPYDAAAIYEESRTARTHDILEHLETRKAIACGIIDLALENLSNPEKYRKASLKTIADVMATVIDKFTPTERTKEIPSVIDGVARELFQGDEEPIKDERKDGAIDESPGGLLETETEAD